MARKSASYVGRASGTFRGAKDNFATLPECRGVPPISQAGSGWKPVQTTPDGDRGPNDRKRRLSHAQ